MTLQLYGELPPVAASAAVYAELTVACGNAVVEIARGEAVSVLEAAAIVTVTASDSWSVKVSCTCS